MRSLSARLRRKKEREADRGEEFTLACSYNVTLTRSSMENELQKMEKSDSKYILHDFLGVRGILLGLEQIMEQGNPFGREG